MNATTRIKHEFVEQIPEELIDGTVYVCIPFATVVHRCLCGCGNEVVTPLSPTDWRLTYDGESVSLYPSIGNWGFDCQSHYWIESDTVKWAAQWSRERIKTARINEKMVKERHFDKMQTQSEAIQKRNNEEQEIIPKRSLLQTIRRFLRL